MSEPTEIGKGQHVRLGTQALNEYTRLYVQNVDDKFKGEFTVRPIGQSVTDIAAMLLGHDYYLKLDRVPIGPGQFWDRTFKYAGAIMEVANTGHTTLRVWTDL